MSAAAPTPIVGVFPALERERLRRLFAALEEAFPVHFEGRREGELRELDAVLELGPGAAAEAGAEAGLAALALRLPEPEPGEVVEQLLGADPRLDRRLHGATLPDDRLGAAGAHAATPGPEGRATVLASCNSTPTWTRTERLQSALLSPRELEPGEALRERLRDGRSAALLPLVHFLRELTAALAWRPPPPRASFLFDDPNLHWPSYGFIGLAELGRHARDHGYHAALATVPLDTWFAHPAALRALRQSQGAISLLVHGNDHYGDELGRLRGEREATALAAQALRRVATFERRTGVAVDPVMVPPHEECSEATVTALRRCGFAAITMTRPYSWLAPPPLSWLTRPAEAGPLVGWRPADQVAGLPVFLRHPFVSRSRAELALRAFLDQPLILYGHQADLPGGLDVLAEAAADVARLGPTTWCSLGEIAAGNYETRTRGATLGLRLLGRGAAVAVPPGSERLLIAPPPDAPDTPAQRPLVDGRAWNFNEPIPVAPGTTASVELQAADAVDPADVAPPRRRPLALPRRALSEGRDRLAPLLSRAR